MLDVPQISDMKKLVECLQAEAQHADRIGGLRAELSFPKAQEKEFVEMDFRMAVPRHVCWSENAAYWRQWRGLVHAFVVTTMLEWSFAV